MPKQKELYCVKCGRKHKSDWGWTYKDWGNGKEGWGCQETPSKHPNIFTPEYIKKSRKKHEKDLLQPFREGQLSGEFAREYPSRVRKMVDEGQVSQKEVREAEDVWK